MELKELCENIFDIFQISNIAQLKNALYEVCLNNDTKKMESFSNAVNDLSVDWLQKAFQYYEADRTEKKQDYTPKTLALFLGKLVGDSDVVIDMCAGSGSLTIQKWSISPQTRFLLYEYDENVIPYLLFNMMIRNIESTVYHSDVLQDEIYHIYNIKKGNKFGILTEET